VVDEKHYTVAEIASLWGLSEESVRRMFQDEEGVLRLSRPRLRGKRAYTTLRIPASTAERVYRHRTTGFRAEVERRGRVIEKTLV